MFKVIKESIRKFIMAYCDYNMGICIDLIEYYEVEGKLKAAHRQARSYDRFARIYMKCMKTNVD